MGTEHQLPAKPRFARGLTRSAKRTITTSLRNVIEPTPLAINPLRPLFQHNSGVLIGNQNETQSSAL